MSEVQDQSVGSQTRLTNHAEKELDIIIQSPERENDGDSNSKDKDQEPINRDAQEGVQYMEAVASVWTKTSLITAYGTAIGTLTPFVTSTFGKHSLTPTVTVLASIILDIWGRHTGIVISIVLTEMGFIMMAACRSIDQYAAAEIFWQVGHSCLLYTVQIIIADAPSLKSRGLMVAYAGSPSLITTWAAGPISQAFLHGPGWPWAFGTFAILTPIVVLPLIVLFQRTPFQYILHYLREFDAVGLLLLTAGLAMFLLPFSIHTYQRDGWRSPLIICLLVFGFALVFVFVAWESRPYVNLFLGLPLTILALGLTYYFSAPGWHCGYFIFTQIMLSIGHAFIILCDEVAAMSAVSHQYVAVVLAMEGLSSSIGGAISSTLSAAIWTSVFPKALAKHLPAKDLPDLEKIYGSLTT
ncbi:MFS general substrate transporter [Mollisia scopiformis]|uniref:MFS general substrate transporter n=1 Tax=Mollisia scopiformis TaxID=149040 RepID=A0A132BBG0_MOLSC|nr:MFS general substrate transporter [Mollisia scopiformis]KUJ09762.1 MFS general substrate transporter [Mollisia scopiformis]